MTIAPNGTEWDGTGCPKPTDKYDIITSEHMTNCPICGPRTGSYKFKDTP